MLLVLGATPTNEMFELSLGYEMGMDLNGGAGEVGYAYYGYTGEMGQGGVGDHLPVGLELGYVMPTQQGHGGEMGVWGVGQAQQA